MRMAGAQKLHNSQAPFGEITRLANVSWLWDTVGMKKTAHPGNHEDRRIEKLLEKIARKKSVKTSDEVNEAAARRVSEAKEER
jgi:hypothetical protein